jgi:hypothetical protein
VSRNLLSRVGWCTRGLGRMSPAEIARCIREEALRRARKRSQVRSGDLDFSHPMATAGKPVPERVLMEGQLSTTTGPAVVASAEHVIVVIGRLVDEHLNPKRETISNALYGYAEHLHCGQLRFSSPSWQWFWADVAS